MTYSVWNQAARAYDYYESPERPRGAAAPKPSHLRATSKHGTHPEAAAWPLPLSAKHVGRGRLAKGFIASRSSGLRSLGLLPFDLTGPNVVILGVVAYLAYERFWKDRP